MHTNLPIHTDIALIKGENLRHNRVVTDEIKAINLTFNEKAHGP